MSRASETRNLGVIPPDAQVCAYGDRIIVVHPNGPPFSIDMNGKREMLEVRDGLPVVKTTIFSGPFTMTAGLSA